MTQAACFEPEPVLLNAHCITTLMHSHGPSPADQENFHTMQAENGKWQEGRIYNASASRTHSVEPISMQTNPFIQIALLYSSGCVSSRCFLILHSSS